MHSENPTNSLPSSIAPDRRFIIDLVENRYFGGVSRGDLSAIRDCFTGDATVIIRHGDNPPRLFSASGARAPEVSDLMEFYVHICGNYECWFGEFEHYIDTEAARAASRFKVRLTPRPEGLYAGWKVQELMNCNFFDLGSDGRISDMIVYYANASGGAGVPTGYPPAGR